MSLAELYGRAPVPLQNAMATGYGVRELSRRYTGSFRRVVAELERHQWADPEELRADQVQRLRELLTWCGREVPHYRDQFRDLGFSPRDVHDVADLAALPLLEKEEVRAEPERFLPDHRERLVAQTTGGTTGTPLRYWATLDAVRFNYATYEARSRRWAGVRLGVRMASLHGQPIVPADDQDGPFWRHNYAFNQLYLSVYHLNPTTLPAYVDALERFAPRVVVGYMSAVHRIATHLLETGGQGRVLPSAVMVSSETLTPAARHDIESAFGCRVFNGYSLGELVAYVSECPLGGLHVSTEYGVLELEDAAVGREIVATGLINKGMPLVRYRTGDLAEAATEPCRCGRTLPVFASLQGRADDVVHTPEGAVVGPAPMSLAFQRVPRLRRAQVHQDDPASMRVLIEPADGFTDDDQAFLDAELRKRLGTALRIDYERVDAMPRTSGGKERLIVSTVGRDPGGSG
ncbi:MAG: phenylacetate--CoA ligase family protein [Actinobacteria bacterium]|nr:phenylacetate--CoA ligase family protein [Actinomycetota bacterium]